MAFNLSNLTDTNLRSRVSNHARELFSSMLGELEVDLVDEIGSTPTEQVVLRRMDEAQRSEVGDVVAMPLLPDPAE